MAVQCDSYCHVGPKDLLAALLGRWTDRLRFPGPPTPRECPNYQPVALPAAATEVPANIDHCGHQVAGGLLALFPSARRVVTGDPHRPGGLAPAPFLIPSPYSRQHPRCSARPKPPPPPPSVIMVDELAAAALQDRRTPHPTCPVLHPAIGRKPVDSAPICADHPAHRATRVASDVIERTVQAETRMDASGSLPTEVGHGRQALGDAVLPRAGTEGTARVA
jgi:hypothetical protein